MLESHTLGLEKKMHVVIYRTKILVIAHSAFAITVVKWANYAAKYNRQFLYTVAAKLGTREPTVGIDFFRTRRDLTCSATFRSTMVKATVSKAKMGSQ